ncbi:Pkinase-domain-containing protein [Hypoxylon sp. NC1633]|nr:Pkinase-domain-containing protein [Hypoxylon sp. NC1633]
MADRRGLGTRPARVPLGDATNRINNAASTEPVKPTGLISKFRPSQPSPLDPLRAHPLNRHHIHNGNASTKTVSTKDKELQTRNNPRAPVLPPAVGPDRSLDPPGTPFNPNQRIKTHIGPWQLGKNLGAGATAQVRLVQHKVTGELAAVKILCKNYSSNHQPGSIMSLDQWDRKRNQHKAEKRMPFAIEREVAIMKLIDHPNIVKLYDIWENRSEIYVVMEYVEKGDFLSYLRDRAPLPEIKAIFFFRQILSALDYIHSLNICHRDLKPENILITETGQLKVSDFGMSAMHQSPYHRLRTSCGSPHYIAPEIVSHKFYRGDTIDIWSLGVILYGIVVGTLPFNDNDSDVLAEHILNARYHMPDDVSPGLRDLISRILMPDPELRYTSKQIWQHPVVRKYDYLDDLGNGGKGHDFNKNARYDAVDPEELDLPTVRQLKSMMHTYTEASLADQLTTPEPNDIKLFYWLLHNYREKTLENYDTGLTHSASDFHHLQPPNWKKQYTTLGFPSKNGRGASKFTVITNVATDENGTALERTATGATNGSYDPYKSSRVMGDAVASQAKIVVHRNSASSARTSKLPSIRSGSVRTNSTYSRRAGSGRLAKAPLPLHGSRQSLHSIRSGEEFSYRRPVSRHKRGVDFSRALQGSVDRNAEENRPASIAGDRVADDRDCASLKSPGKRSKLNRNSGRSCSGTQSMAEVFRGPEDGSHWNEELRHFSSSIAKDCDDAFNSTLLSPQSHLSNTPFESSLLDDTGTFMTPANTPTSILQGPRLEDFSFGSSRDMQSMRPTPPPKDSEVREIYVQKKRTGRHQGDIREIANPAGNIGTQPNEATQHGESSEMAQAVRRAVSAPIYKQHSAQWFRSKITLPSINEGSREDVRRGNDDGFRNISAPVESTAAGLPQRGEAEEMGNLVHLSHNGETIRVVDSPSNQPGQASAPQTPGVRNYQNPRGRPGLKPLQPYINYGMNPREFEEPIVPSRKSSTATIKKKSSWLKRGSKDRAEVIEDAGSFETDYLSRTDTLSSAGPPAKKKSFGFAFWRGNKAQQPKPKFSLAGPERDDSPSPERSSRAWDKKKKRDSRLSTRSIEPQQTWLARLFRVKPATRYMCFATPQRIARQELAQLLRSWRCYGMKDIVVDKKRSLVFARVAKNNSLDLKEASFAAEIMTVIEHGNRNRLCIVRFTQERGAATTFHKVVDTLIEIFTHRDMIVTDKYKAKMMVKTLNA